MGDTLLPEPLQPPLTWALNGEFAHQVSRRSGWGVSPHPYPLQSKTLNRDFLLAQHPWGLSHNIPIVDKLALGKGLLRLFLRQLDWVIR